MNNNEEKFFLYLKGKMELKEKLSFEEELKNSKKLNSEFQEYKDIENLISKTKNLSLSKEYSESLVPNFRNKKVAGNTKKSFSNFKYAFATILIIVAGYFGLNQFTVNNETGLKQVISSLSDNEKKFVTDDFYVSNDFIKNVDDITSQKIDSIYTFYLKEGVVESIENRNVDIILNEYYVIDINDYLTDNQVDEIYSKLIGKEIL